MAHGVGFFPGVRRELDREALTAVGGDRISPVLLDVTEADQVAVAQAVLPRLRASRGRVVFVSR